MGVTTAAFLIGHFMPGTVAAAFVDGSNGGAATRP